MGWSYEADPATSVRDALRLEMGDTKKNVSETMTDEELQWCLTKYSLNLTDVPDSGTLNQILLAAADGCEILAGRFAKEASYGAAGISESSNQKAQEMRARAKKLRQRGLATAMPSIGGRSQAVKDAAADRTDLPQPSFARGMMENA